MTGIALIVKPPFLFGTASYEEKRDLLAATAVIFSSVFLESNAFVLIRMLNNIHWSITNSVFGCIGFVQAICVALLIGQNVCLPDSGLETFYVVMTGCLGFFGQFFMQVAASYENAASISLLRKAFDVILAFGFQLLLFKVCFKIFHRLKNQYSQF